MPLPDDPQIDRFYASVGDRVRDARSAARMTQAELADRLSLARSSIANIEAGRQRIPLHVFFLIADALGADAKDLLPNGVTSQETPKLSNIEARLAAAPDESSRDFIESALANLTGQTGTKE
ncbi:helix-turn-helix domain-containing protein [Streptomyces dysideae]|uniref:helix-turn-helix domain-containing protein n=1 Tax=Streptomyces dysideae TaxID=909626 RepID=UPI00099E590C|nr:helix-turn-helix transcriptional regulator [Streptomyces dysideae]